MTYDQEKGWESNWEFDSQSQIPLEQGSKDPRLGRAIHHWKDLFKGYKYCSHIFKINLICKRHERAKFWDNKSPNFGTPTWESQEKVPFGCSPYRKAQNIL
jgi:hypothetical protein